MNPNYLGIFINRIRYKTQVTVSEVCEWLEIDKSDKTSQLFAAKLLKREGFNSYKTNGLKHWRKQ